MKLLQFRQGFATNSSSSHSIIIANPLTKLVLTGKGENAGDDYTPGEFGWEPFTIASEKGRMEYYAYLIEANLDLPFWMKEALAFSVTGIHITEDGYIDHQSVLTLPKSWKSEGLDQQFLQEIKAFLLQDGITIIGGNDNQEDSHSMAKCGPVVLNKMPHHGEWVCRKNGDEWTLFERNEGTKVTFTFDGTKIERTRPSAPELIDIKITNFCPYACAYCYQGSTAQGKHADEEKIRDIALQCEENKVFEVAIGGGEPTLHPDFEDILHTFRTCGVVPNFTTRNLSWLRDEKRRPLILKECGAFAVSVNEPDMVKELGELVKRYDIENKVVVHYVLGSASEWSLESILRECFEHSLGLTLLGWKRTGRGETGPLHGNENWLEIVKKYSTKYECPRIGIDTCIANEYENEIKQANIPDWLFYTEEGKFSMYYDAIEEKWGPSSFCEDDEYVKLKAKDGRNMIQAWNKIKPTKSMKGKKNVKSVDGV